MACAGLEVQANEDGGHLCVRHQARSAVIGRLARLQTGCADERGAKKRISNDEIVRSPAWADFLA